MYLVDYSVLYDGTVRATLWEEVRFTLIIYYSLILVSGPRAHALLASTLLML